VIRSQLHIKDRVVETLNKRLCGTRIAGSASDRNGHRGSCGDKTRLLRPLMTGVCGYGESPVDPSAGSQSLQSSEALRSSWSLTVADIKMKLMG
jgi:hypothetical protein